MQGSKSTWWSDAVNQLRLKQMIFICSIQIIMDTQSLLFHRQTCICQWIKKRLIHILIINSISILHLMMKVSINSQQLHKIKLVSVFTRKISSMYVDTLLMAYFKVNNYLFVLQVDSLFYSSENLFYLQSWFVLTTQTGISRRMQKCHDRLQGYQVNILDDKCHTL